MAPLAVLILGLLGLGAVLWLVLERHEGRRAARGLPRHGRWRIAVAAAALLAALFAAMTAFLAISSAARIGMAAALGLPPFLAGLIVCYLAMRRGTG